MTLAERLDPPPRFDNVEAFLAWAERQPERYELVDGEARLMTGGSRNHARIARNALTALSARLGASPCEPFGGDLAVVLGPGRVAYPDASVSCEPEQADALRRPVVIVEALSPSTAGYDRGDKAAAYRRLPSLRHLVLVRQDRIGVEHFHRVRGDEDFTLSELDRLDATLALPAIGVDMPVAELYARVSFAEG